MTKNNLIFIWLVSAVLISSCDKTEWDKEVPLSLEIQSDIDNQIEVEDYTIEVENIEMTITSIQIHGERLQADDVEIIYNDNVYLDFSDPENVNYKIDLPFGTYEKLNVTIHFDTEISSPQFMGQIEGNENQPFQSTLNIPLSFTEIENLQVKNQNNENVVLIDENSKSIEFVFDIQASFDEIDLSLWDALINANQGQNEMDLSTVLGTQFLEDINNNFLSTVQLKVSN